MRAKTTFFLALITSTIAAPDCLSAPVAIAGRSWKTVLEQNANTLTYSFDLAGGLETDVGTSVSLDTLFANIPGWRDILSRALQDWGTASGITFTEVVDSGTASGAPGASGDIRLTGHRQSGSWAHAYLPMESQATEATKNNSWFGDIHFNTELAWDSARLLSVTLHEAGHSLGLAHNLDPNSVMFGLDKNSEYVTNISDRDLTDFRALYFAMNSPAEILTNPVINTVRDWFSVASGTTDQRASVTIAGNSGIATVGEQKTAIKGIGAVLADRNYGFDYVDLILDSGASLITRGDNAYGIAAGSANTLTINGRIETSGISSDGVALLDGNNTLISSTASTIQTRGAGANGIFSGGRGQTGRNTITADGRIETQGDGAAGIYSQGYTDLTLNGDISTQGLYAAGIGMDQGGHNKVVVNDEAVISTTGISGYGILARDVDNNVIMKGEISTSGDAASGIYGHATYGNFFGIDGYISTTGKSSHGVFMYGGENQVLNTGRIVTEGFDALGILLGGAGYRLANYGSIATSGDTAHGIMLAGSNNQAVSTGNIFTSGASANAVDVRGRENTWHSSGLIVTQGNDSSGISVGGDANFLSNTGQLETTGDGSVGILFVGDDNIAKNAGSIITTGKNADGIYLGRVNNTLVNQGRIQAAGDFANGVLARGNQNRIDNAGRIETSGAGAYGIIANGSGNRVQVSGTVVSKQAAAISVGGKWSFDTNSIDQTTGTGNVLLINASAQINGDITNDGAADGALALFGAALDENSPSGYVSAGLDMNYAGKFRGNAWTGEVLAGRLRLNSASNSFSQLTVHEGATLGGNTTLTGNLINNGRVAPGNSIGTIAIAGDYAQGASAVLDLEIGGSQADLLAVSGNATFNAGSRLSLTPIAPVLGGNYSLVTVAGNLSGSPLPAFTRSAILDYTLLNDGSSGIGVHVDRTAYATFASTANQRGVAGILDGNLATAGGDAANVLLAIDGLKTARDVQQSLNALVPGSYTALPDAGFVGMRNFVSALPSAGDILLGRNRRNTASWQLKASHNTESLGENNLAYGQTIFYRTHRGDGATGSGYRVQGGGIVAGSDRRFDDGLVGSAFSYQRATINHDGSASSSDSETWMAAIRSAVNKDRWLFQGVLAYGYQRETSQRAIAAAGFSREATSRSHAQLLYTNLEGRYLMGNESLAINPFAGIDYAAYFGSRVKERGAEALNADIDRIDARSMRISAGVELASRFDFARSLSIDSFAQFGMRRELRDASYGYVASMMGGNVSVLGAETCRKTRFVTLGLRTGMAGKTTGAFHLQYERQASDYGLAVKAEISIPF